MRVLVGMALTRFNGELVVVLMMLIVNMRVLVLHRLVRVLMLVLLREMQCNAKTHQ